MLLILKYVAKLMKALASEASPNQLAFGFVLGMIVGLTPLMSLHNLLVLIIVLIVKVNLGMVLLGFFVFSGIAYMADPVFHNLGVSLLENEGLQEMWTNWYNNEWIALTKFYNTVVLGSLLSALALAIPLFPLTIVFIKQYRKNINEKVKKWKIVRWFKGTKLYSIYQTIDRVAG